jgi:tetratricopeptide (TPR) repeat protein
MIFGASWFVVFLLVSFVRPTTNYIPDFLEHRTYLPIVGIIIFLLEVIPFKKINRKILIGVTPVIFLFLIILNINHQKNFFDKMSFWNNAVEASPSHPLVHKNLGAMFYLAGDKDRAEEEYQKSISIYDKEKMVYNNLGLIYFERGEFEKAEEMYEKEIEINPLYDDAYFNRGLLAYEAKDFQKAKKLWKKTLQINPNHSGAKQNLKFIAESGF